MFARVERENECRIDDFKSVDEATKKLNYRRMSRIERGREGGIIYLKYCILQWEESSRGRHRPSWSGIKSRTLTYGYSSGEILLTLPHHRRKDIDWTAVSVKDVKYQILQCFRREVELTKNKNQYNQYLNNSSINFKLISSFAAHDCEWHRDSANKIRRSFRDIPCSLSLSLIFKN